MKHLTCSQCRTVLTRLRRLRGLRNLVVDGAFDLHFEYVESTLLTNPQSRVHARVRLSDSLKTAVAVCGKNSAYWEEVKP